MNVKRTTAVLGMAVLGLSIMGRPIAAYGLSQDGVEIVIDGKHYDSIKDYRRQKIKDQIGAALTTESLKLFSERELIEMLREVRAKKMGKTITPKAKEDREDLTEQKTDRETEEYLKMTPEEMDESLDEFLQMHENTEVSDAPHSKMKTVNIQPKTSQ